MISPPQDESRLFGVLVTFRRPEILRTTLNLLGKQTRSIDHLIVVDNAPTEQTRDVVAQYSSAHGSTEWLPMSDNLGPAGGVAAGVQRALDLADERDWVLILDDDDPPRSETIIERLFSLAREALDADPTTGGFGLSGGRFDPKRGRIQPLPDVALSGFIGVDVIADRDTAVLSRGHDEDRGDLSSGALLRARGHGLWLASREGRLPSLG